MFPPGGRRTFPPESRNVSAGVRRGFRRVPWRFAGKAGAGLPRVTGAAVPMGPAPETAAALFPAV